MAFTTPTALSHVVARSTNNNSVTSPPFDTTGADLLIVAVSSGLSGGVASFTITDSKNNVWTKLTTGPVQGGLYAQLVYAVRPVVGTNHTVTISSPGGFPAVAVLAATGAHPSVVADQQGSASFSSATSVQLSSQTPNAADELLLVALALNDSTSAMAVDSGFTILEDVDATANAFGLLLAYKTQPSQAAVAPIVSWTTSTLGSAVSAGFIPASAAARATRSSAGRAITLAAAGSTQASATPILSKSPAIVVSDGHDLDGIRLPAATRGKQFVIKNLGTDALTGKLNLYPEIGDRINGQAQNVPLVMPAKSAVLISALDSVDWYTVPGIPS